MSGAGDDGAAGAVQDICGDGSILKTVLKSGAGGFTPSDGDVSRMHPPPHPVRM